MTTYTYSGHQAHGWTFEPYATGPQQPGVRAHRPGHPGIWLPLAQVDTFADELRAAARGAAENYANRNRPSTVGRMTIAGWKQEPRKHPKDPAGYFDFLGPGELAPLLKPVPGYRYHSVRADGTITRFENSTTSHEATHGQRPSLLGVLFQAPAPKHEPDCSCGYRVVKDLPTLVAYIRHQVEHNRLENQYEPGGPASVCVIECTGEGWAAVIPDRLIQERRDPRKTLRVSRVTLGRTVWLPEKWGDLDIPESLAEKIRQRYPGVTVKRVPTLYQFPGIPYPGPPNPPPGRLHHRSGRFGRYGAAGALVRHDGRYLLVKRRDTWSWAPPGGAIGELAEDPWETAQRELTEETEQQFQLSDPHGHVIYQGELGWSFTTYAADAQDPEPLNISATNPEVIDAGWFTEHDMRHLNLMPEFEKVLPDLLEMFDQEST